MREPRALAKTNRRQAVTGWRVVHGLSWWQQQDHLPLDLTSWIQYLLWWEVVCKSLVSIFYILSSVSGCIQCNLVSWWHISQHLRSAGLGWAGLGWAANPIISRHQTVILQCHFASLHTNQTINGSSEAPPEVWRLKIDN